MREPAGEQPWPLLVGGGPAPAAATFIHVHATTERLAYRMFDLGGKPVGEWELVRRGRDARTASPRRAKKSVATYPYCGYNCGYALPDTQKHDLPLV